MQNTSLLPGTEARLPKFIAKNVANLATGITARIAAKTLPVVFLALTGWSAVACSLLGEDESIASASQGVRSSGGDRGHDDPDSALLTTGDTQDQTNSSQFDPVESNTNAESGGHIQVEDATDVGDAGESTAESTVSSSGGTTTEETTGQSTNESTGESTAESTTSTSGGTTSEETTGETADESTEGTDTDDTEGSIAIIVPEVYSANQRIGYLIGIDETAVLKIWDDEKHRIYRINEKTGYLVGISTYHFYSDRVCTIPQVFYGAPDSLTCFRGSSEAAKVVFAERGNATGTVQGNVVKTYASAPKRTQSNLLLSNEFNSFLPDFPQNSEDPSLLCYDGQVFIEIGKVYPERSPFTFTGNLTSHRGFKPSYACLYAIEDIDDGKLAWPLPIEVRTPTSNRGAAIDQESKPKHPRDREEEESTSTLGVYSAGKFLGHFIGFNETPAASNYYRRENPYRREYIKFNDELITVYDPIHQRIFSINKVTGIVWGGRGLHAFGDEACATQHLSHLYLDDPLFCGPVPEGISAPRRSVWSYKGDPDGWREGQYILSTVGAYKSLGTVYLTPWYLLGCSAKTNRCVMDAERIDDLPLSFPTPIEVRRGVER